MSADKKIVVSQNNTTVKVSTNSTSQVKVESPAVTLAKLSVKGIQGDQGPRGPGGGATGPTGPAGDRYSTTSSTVVETATGAAVFLVDPGLAYSTGQSVIAAHNSSNTLEGTVTDYISSGTQGALSINVTSVVGTLGQNLSSWDINLVGTPGADGPAGPTGAQGPTGAVGATGVAGATGPRGATGAGVTGPTGAAGLAGVAGATGVSGPTGPRGATGVAGAQGTLGDAGPTGPAGVKGATGSQGVTGPTGPTERLTNDITVYLPDATGEFIFGKFKHNDVISATSASENKSALDIIKEALIQLGSLGNVTLAPLAPSPTTIGYSSSSTTNNVTLQCSCVNVNSSQGSTLSFLFEEATAAENFSELSSVTGVSGDSATASVDVVFSAFPDGEERKYRCTVTESQTLEEKTSNVKTYAPTYSSPSITLNQERVTDASSFDEGGGESDTARQLYNGEVQFKGNIIRNTPGVALDSYEIFDSLNNSVIAHDAVDISSLSSYNLENATNRHDLGFSNIGDTEQYTIKVWDERSPRTSAGSTPAKSNTDSLITFKRIDVRVITSTTELDENSSASDWQDMYDGNSAGHTGSFRLSELITSSGDLNAANSSELDASMRIDSSASNNDFLYVYFPSYYISDGDITGPGNTSFQILGYSSSASSWGGINSLVTQDYNDSVLAVNSAAYLRYKTNFGVQVQFGSASNKVDYEVLRIRQSLDAVTQAGKYIRLRNSF